jgi:HEAT repeat protein
MRFDPISFLLGFLSASGVSVAVWRSRSRLSNIQQSAEAQIEGTKRFIGRTAEARYAGDLLRYLQQHHIAGDQVNLTDILLEPRLIPGPGPLEAPGDDNEPVDRSVFDVVPLFHDMPASHAPFNVETFSLLDLGSGDRHVAILGLPGTGKSTALATLALIALGEVEFETLEDLTEKAIVEEEKSLSKEEREQRVKEREQIQARAMEKLHDARERERERMAQVKMQVAEELPSLDISRLMPVLIHLSELELSTSYVKGEKLDPAEPLVRAVQRQVSGITGQVVGSVLYPMLEMGRALVLLDGYDDLSPSARQDYFYWLQQLIDTYGHNIIVIAGPVEGYEPLVTLGFTPTFLRPWTEDDYNLLAKRWSVSWATHDKRQSKAAVPDDQTMRRITIDNRGRSILDVTLKIWTGLADDARETGRIGWYDAWVNRHLPEADLQELLSVLAARMLDAGQPTEWSVLQETITNALTAPDDSKKAPKPEDILEPLLRNAMLIPYPGDTFALPHSQIASYLASQALIREGGQQAAEVALNPAWQDALAFAAARIDMQPVIYRKLGAPPDLLYSNLFELVRWLPDAPVDAPWRGDLFKRLAAALIAPEQYPTVRERAMAALVASRDKNVLFILRQALRSADPGVRGLACIGLGAIGNPEAIKDLAPMLSDEDRDVQLAAGLALGAIGSEKALEVMVESLLHGADELRRAVAEALAGIPGEGHAVLRDGIQSEDLMIRRAAVYGLSRVKAPWALVELYRAMLEDEQWYVRTAAEDAFMKARSPEREGPHAHPEADALYWLVRWAADQGEGVPAGVNARQILIRALQEGKLLDKMMAALTLGRLGHVQALKPLYAALRDRSPDVRGAAYEALAAIQTRLGEPLPSVV